MLAEADDLAVLQDENLVGGFDGGDALGDLDDGDAFAPFADARAELLLRRAVESGCGIVQNQQPRLFQQGSRDGKALLLAARKRYAALPDDGLEAVFETGYELIGLRGLRDFDDLLVRRVRISPADVFGDRAAEEDGFLQDHAHEGAQFAQFVILHVVAVDRHHA